MKNKKIIISCFTIFLSVLFSVSLTGGAVKAADSFIAYGWNAYRGNTGIEEGTIKLEVPDGNITLLATESEFFMSGGDFVDNILYMVSYPIAGQSSLYTVDTTTGVYNLIGNTNVDLSGFTYDVSTGIAYGASGSNLYSINLDTGAGTLIGPINTDLIIGIACDAQGNLYGVDVGEDSLYSINKTTGSGTVIGYMGIDINYAQDICFDRDSGTLYGTLYANSGGLYEINTVTGATSLLKDISAEIDAFAIPYNLQEYTINASVNLTGAGSITGAGTYVQGNNITLYVTANPGYKFINWTEDGNVLSKDASYSFTLGGDRNLVANFIVPVTGITLNSNNITLNAKGSSYQCIPTINPINATQKDIIWTSTNPSVATVSDKGLVKPLVEGTTIIRATSVDGQLVAEAVVNVGGVLPQTGVSPMTVLLPLIFITSGIALLGIKK
ncbi:MAG: Ig-like domain-containing protein [Firmicutes bacterium]|nr:Ig-like domain-containing protein [Bacillota bacterium]